MDSSTTQVQSLYERHPYPHYPLLANPRWQDGYLGSSLFAQHLIYRREIDTTLPRQFLSIGCGEILPYIIRQWEPSATQITCVDLSQRSLRRAQFRTALLGRRVHYQQSDINDYLSSKAFSQQKTRISFNHVEAYGVLHHISTFKTTLNLIRDHMAPDGIFRIMVYNTKARDWIWDINRAYCMLGLNFASDDDVKVARALLKKLAILSPRLQERLRQMGEASLENNTRFADTFLHPWESRASIKQWFEAFGSAGLKPVALHDRYGELEDLPNPLWRCPTPDELSERADDLRFENNLEIWLTRDDSAQHSIEHNKISQKQPIPFRLRTTMPPTRFRAFEETRNLPFGTKLALWQGFVKSIYNRRDLTAEKLLCGLDRKTSARLARIGFILPETGELLGLYDHLLKPIHRKMSPPTLGDQCLSEYQAEVYKLCLQIQTSPEKSDQAARRLFRAM